MMDLNELIENAYSLNATDVYIQQSDKTDPNSIEPFGKNKYVEENDPLELDFNINNSIFLSNQIKREKNNPQISNGNLNDKKIDISKTKKTAEKTLLSNPKVEVEKIKERVIIVKKKKKKKLGRKRNNLMREKRANHSKYDEDNIILKMKRKILQKNLIKLLEHKISKSNNKDIKKIKLKKINGDIIKNCKKDYNINLLENTLRNILSNPLSNKFKKVQINYNKKAIDLIYEKNETELIKILDKKFKEIIKIYVDDTEEVELFEGFIRIKDDKKKFFIEGNDQEYVNSYEKIANNFEEIFINKVPKKKKNLIQRD